jgi:hypothetical protein
MRKFLLVSTAALFAGLVPAVPVVSLAQARTAIVSGVPVDAVVMRAGSAAAKVRKLKAVPSVGVVDIRNLHGSAGMRWHLRNELSTPFKWQGLNDYRLLVSRNADGVAKLRAALRANPATRKALARRGIPISRIIGLDISSNGSIRAYVL